MTIDQTIELKEGLPLSAQSPEFQSWYNENAASQVESTHEVQVGSFVTTTSLVTLLEVVNSALLISKTEENGESI